MTTYILAIAAAVILAVLIVVGLVEWVGRIQQTTMSGY